MKKQHLMILLAVIVLFLSSLACDDGGIVDNDCSTCGTATSGGQVMNPDNVVQQGWNLLDAVSCNDTSYKGYNDSHCVDYRASH